MSECEFQNKVGPYADGELLPPAAGEIELHLKTCPRCQASLARVQALDALVANSRDAHIPQITLARLHQHVDRLSTKSIRHMAETLAAIAAVILISSVAWLAVLSETSSPAEADTWQMAAATSQSPEQIAQSTEDQLAMWIAQDLRREQNQ